MLLAPRTKFSACLIPLSGVQVACFLWAIHALLMAHHTTWDAYDFHKQENTAIYEPNRSAIV